MSALLPVGVAWLLGYFAVRLWLPAMVYPQGLLLNAALGFGLGTGVTSLLYWALVACGAEGLPVLAGLEVVLLGGLGWLVYRQRGRGSEAPPALESPVLWVALAGAVVLLAIFVAGFQQTSEISPQGGWDAFSIWNLRARYLLHSNTWRFAVTSRPVGTHMEYPLLLSSAVARGWTYTGDMDGSAPIAIAVSFAAALALLLVSALSVVRSLSVGLLAGAILLANPSLLTQTAAQYADVPVGYYFLGGLALLALGREKQFDARYLTLAGMFAALGAWTKNEGLLFLAALTVVLLLDSVRGASWGEALRRTAIFLAGALPVMLVVLWFKAAVAPPDPMAHQVAALPLAKLLSGARWAEVAAGFWSEGWRLYVYPAPVVVLLAAAAALLRPRQDGPVALAAAVLLVLIGFFGIFLVTTNDVSWLIGTSLERLYLQVWPSLVLAVFLLLRVPGDYATACASASPRREKTRKRTRKSST